jgi:protein AroM
MRPRLGIVTIGQTPRHDLYEAFAREAVHAEVVVRGALDGLEPAEARALADEATDYPLLVRLADGTSAEVPLQALHTRVAAAAMALAADGAYAVVLACAGAFPDVPCPVPVILPGRIMPAAVRALVHSRRIGVVAPIAGQLAAADAKWRSDGFDPVMTWASPLRHDEIDGAADAMRAAAPELVVLDCMGHDDAYAHRFAARCGRPVLSAQSVTARLAGALIPPT